MSGIIFFAFVAGIIIYIVSRRHIEHMVLIEQGIVPQSMIKKHPINRNYLSLFYGLFAVGTGLSILIGSLVAGISEGVVFFGIILICTGAATLTFWKLTAPDRKKAIELYEQQQKALLGLHGE